jgi:RsiW-degrading membrane proteinase PrsW (M82 family)
MLTVYLKVAALILIGVWVVVAFLWHWYAEVTDKPEPKFVALTAFIVTIVGTLRIILWALSDLWS